jgi:hypothetical protein
MVIGVNEDYKYLFKDTSWNRLDSLIGGSRISNSGVYNVYHYHPVINEHYIVNIWELKNISTNILENVSFFDPSSLPRTDIKNGEVFSPDSPMPILVRFKYNFLQGMNVKPGYSSTIDTTFQSKTYKGFVGDFDKIVLENKTGEDMIIFEYKPPYRNLLFLLYSSGKGTFIITVNSEREVVDIGLLDIFSFDN